MLLRLCQLKSLLLLLMIALSSCSFFRATKKHDVEGLLTSVSPHWFTKNPQHSLHDQNGKTQIHNFFDINPQLSKNDIFINATIITPYGSDHGYQLDLASGQRYYSHSYCPQTDIWKQYSGSISTPIFSTGVIPRLLDQLGEPQKVVIFGGNTKYAQLVDNYEHRIKLVGAFIEQACPAGNCLGKDNWISRMVFLAVDPEDKNYNSVEDIQDLQGKIKWDQTKAILENIDGRNGGSSGVSYPAVRIGQLIKIDEAMDYYKTRSIYLSGKETQKIQSGCHALYDRLWSEIGAEQPEDRASKTVEELNQKLKLIAELKKQKRPVGFAARFKVFIKKYYSEFTTCQRFVYAGNVNQDQDKFWFLNYTGIFFQLHKEGFYFDCKSHTWQRNLLNNLGTPVYDIKQKIDSCNERDFDLAMEYLPNFLIGLKNSDGTYFRFAEYDTHSFGTHQKLYSWVKVRTKKYECQTDPNIEIRKELKAFPEDVFWKKRDVKDIEDELKIIY